MKVSISPVKKLIGEITVPGDKSISHRGVMLGAIAKGKTHITNFLMGEDCLSTIKAFQAMGIEITVSNPGTVEIIGRGLHGLHPSPVEIDAGNSGTTTRLLMGILAGQPFETILNGDPSLRKRPMQRVTLPLMQMGANIHGQADGKFLPMTIKGGNLQGIDYTLPIASAQVKSALILATLYAQSPSRIVQPAFSRDHTERMLQYFGGKLDEDGLTLTAYPAQQLSGQSLQVPGDISSAAFFIAAGLLVPHSCIAIRGVGLNHTRTGILDVFQQMGADILVENIVSSGGERVGDLSVSHSQLHGTIIEGDMIPRLIDEIPIIALAATQATGTTVIRDASELKVKESDRIETVVNALRILGAEVEATADGMVIQGPTPLKGNTIKCEMDHRIAMMGAVAGLLASGETILDGGEWVDISFPNFFELIKTLRQ